MDFKVIEAKWQKFWEEHPELYRADDDSDKEKKYILVEFPYPSGNGLHVGHAFSFTGGDVYARFKRMQGYNVMFPMGWDAFGLPTENYAIKTKRKPQEVTKENTDMFRSQMKRLAYSFDWQREINTTDSNYYKWTQWIFIQLFKKGLAYKKEMPINWCPSCKIGLANEEIVDGKCERCGAEVERRTISQWVIKITEYADKLISGLEKTEFIDKVKQAQINWIGKKEGLTIDFKIKNDDSIISCFTKYPETIFGVSWVVVSPEYPNLKEIITGEQKDKVEEYIKNASKKSELERTSGLSEKTGVFTGSYVINPVNGKEVPIWVGDYVLANFGTGAVMGVAPHDNRDFMFAKRYGLEMLQVEIPKGKTNYVVDSYEKVIDDGILINSSQFNGLEARTDGYQKICDWMVEKGWAKKKTEYHLRDWIFSRQHYWGEPIPMINCSKCGWVPVEDKDLPVKLPEVENYEPTDDGKSPLSKIESFVKCKCPICGGEAVRETDTMPNWAGSDWYYLAYCFASKMKKNEANDTFIDIFSDSNEELKKWCPVDIYMGGDEHNTLHLLYSRFIYQFLYDIGVVPKEIEEPYFKRISHGVILGPDNQRMSKSKGNVIVPETVADKYGVDVIRMYLMFIGPFDGTMAWNENTLMGVKRFLDRFYRFVNEQIKLNSDSGVKNKVIINKTILGIGEDLETFGFNTAIAKLMEALNGITEANIDDLKVLVKLVAPMAPYTAEELWESLGGEGSVHQSSWPKYEERYLKEEKIILPIAINGKVRDQLQIIDSESQTKEKIIKEAKELKKVKDWIEGKEIIKEIYIPGKMLNLVLKK